MAENVLMTRIQLKYDTLTNWNSSSLILKKGELAIVEVPTSTSNSGLTPPAIGIKVGDGEKTFSQLPWIQAAAGDVYAWAKAAEKPTYAATEISGLDAYISGHIGDTTYQIIRGTDEDINKWFLQSTKDGTTWTTVSTIDFTDLNGRVNTLENWANVSNGTLTNQIDARIAAFSAGLINDTPVEHQFITGLSMSAGKIQATRAAITMNDISGTLPVAKGGTGQTTLTAGQVLIGEGTEGVSTRAIDTTVTANSTNLVTSGAVQTAINSATAGLSGAMHFKGIATRAIGDNTDYDPGIDGYTTRTAGDVVLGVDGYSEYVWTGTVWERFGDEVSYAVKGSITNLDIASNAAIAQTKIAGTATGSTSLADDLSKKVDKVEGKGLSTNDYTTVEKTKLSNIAEGAQVNTIESVSVNNVPITPDANKNINIDLSNVGTVQGARVPNGNSYEDITIDSTTHKLELARIAKTGNVNDLVQTTGDVLILQCGTSSTVI